MNNSQKIDEFIKTNPDCKIPKQLTVVLNGNKRDLETYRLPLELTFYNIKNGRFAAEYIDLVKNEGRELNPLNSVDSKKIQNLLIEIDPKQSKILQQDIQLYGQRDPGIVTYDGFIINGNRRRAALETLVSEGHSNFKYIIVSRLPQNVTTQDLWKLEAGIQLSKNVQLDYGPINELLKFKEGVDAGLAPIEIAKSLYGGFKEKDILEKLEQLKLISQYLQFIGEPGVFNRAKGIHEHFIDLRNILNSIRKRDSSPDEQIAVKRIGFQLIHDGVTQRELRKIKDIMVHEKTKKEFWQAIPHSKPEAAGEKRNRFLKADQNLEFTPARTLFNSCLDTLTAITEENEPEKLLKRALTNLENIRPSHKALKRPETKLLIQQIETIIKNLKF